MNKTRFYKILLTNFCVILTLILGACTGSILEEKKALSETPAGLEGIELDEYIPPGIQFIEKTTQGMEQEGFPYLKNNRVFNIKWIIKTCTTEEAQKGLCQITATGSSDQIQNPDPGFYISSLQYSSDNGTTWSAITGASDLGGYNDQIQSFSWSIPLSVSVESNQYLFRLTTQNAQGTQFKVNSNTFTLDNTPPTITPLSLKFNNSLDSPLVLRAPGVSIDFNAQDNLTPIDSYCLKENANQPLIEDSCWIKFSSIGITEATSVQVSKIRKVLGWIGGSFSYYFWVKDKSGNVSALTGGIGAPTIDTRTISYTPGRAIYFTKTLASNWDNTTTNPEITETIINSDHNTVYIKWNFTLDSTAELDAVEPYKIEYSLDGSSFSNIKATNGTTLTDAVISSTVDLNCSPLPFTLPETITKCYKWQVPSSVYSTNLYIRIHVKDSAGFQYTISPNPLNLNSSINVNNLGLGLRIVGGQIDSMTGASALSTKFDVAGGVTAGRLAVHEDGRIFVLDSSNGIFVISPLDGKAINYVKSGGSIDGVAVDNPSLLGFLETEALSNAVKISLDYKGRLLIMENNKIRRVTDLYDNQGNLTGRRNIETIVGCKISTCYYNNIEKNTASGGKWPNAWIYADEFNLVSPYNWRFRHFTPTPTGDIYFSVSINHNVKSDVVPTAPNYYGLDFRIYRPGTTDKDKVYPLKLNGAGILGEPFKPISDLYPTSMGGLAFNSKTGTPTTLHMIWQLCPTSGQTNWCTFYTSNHNPKTGASNGTGTHYYSIYKSLLGNNNQFNERWSANYYNNFITSRRGELYLANQYLTGYSLSKLNPSTNKFVKILGGKNVYTSGYCSDGTLAVECNTLITDAWITQDNTIYFIDNSQIRMIGKDGRVATLFGRKPADRNDEDSMLSTFGRIDNVALWKDLNLGTTNLMIKEQDNYVLREISLNGNIKKIAGDESTFWNYTNTNSASKAGYNVTNNLATNMGYWSGSWGINPPLIVDSLKGEPFYMTPDIVSVSKLIRQENTSNPDNGRWLRLIGGGNSTTPLLATKGANSCDGKKNNECRTDWSSMAHILAFIPEKPLFDSNGNPLTPRSAQVLTLVNRHGNYNGAPQWGSYYLKLLNSETGQQTHFAGSGDTYGWNTVFPNSLSGVPMANTLNIPSYQNVGTKFIYDTIRDALIVAMPGSVRIGIIQFKIDPLTQQITEAGDYFNLTDTTYAIAAFTHTNQNGKDYIYYCSTSGGLYKRIASSTSTTESQIALPTGMTCNPNSRSIENIVDTDLNSIKIYFPLIFRGQYVVGEYNDTL